MIPPQLITLMGGLVSGFVFKFIAQRAKEKHESFTRLIKKGEFQEKAHDSAAARLSKNGIDAGKWTRRLIVVATLFGVIIAPFVLALLNQPVYAQIDEISSTWLFGLFGGATKTVFVRIDGFLMVPEVRQTLTTLIGFYFGSSCAK
jgi:hypothetical protein